MAKITFSNIGQAILPDIDGGPSREERLVPLAYAGGMLAIGAALLLARPGIGEVPEASPLGHAPRRGRLRRAAHWARDGLQSFAPTNVTDSLGRSLVIGGAALLLTRLLDEVAGPED
ncbi:hypothetical protein [Pseudoroseicyclus sp. CXY001]|uniref:hypothetical protein n=1 Tax=Pseudoroseicyclus sp. CXY001 TaxID=3242492 RepID=UPI0035715258